MDNVRKTLINKLDECGIECFVLDAVEKTLKISYKEDFDAYLKQFSGITAKVMEDAGRIQPYGWDHFAFFEYNGWEISGNIICNKPKKTS